ncbi:unnamed protein product [Rodentolepis nana]|uniref:Uncharacterized protein n=1 Tax=Rodentolepis nana TaxID=102285 RepID=A0A3P7V9C0_RODNA|nr:unnamed protein product [Rodentolepis nana]
MISRRRSSGSFDEEDNPYKINAHSNPPRDSNKSVILTGVRAIPSDLRRTPSPVDFNAYATEQTEVQKFPHQPKWKSSSTFLEEVETHLPKRRPVLSNDTRRREDPCANSDHSVTHFNRMDYDDYATLPKTTQHRNDPADIPLVRRPYTIEQIGYRHEDYMCA